MSSTPGAADAASAAPGPLVVLIVEGLWWIETAMVRTRVGRVVRAGVIMLALVTLFAALIVKEVYLAAVGAALGAVDRDVDEGSGPEED